MNTIRITSNTVTTPDGSTDEFEVTKPASYKKTPYHIFIIVQDYALTGAEEIFG